MLNKDIHERYPGYIVTSCGVVIGLNGSQLCCNPRADGYVIVGLLNNDGAYDVVYLHRLVAACFLGLDIDDGSIEVGHKDDNRSNNKLSNLQLLTCSQNNLKAAGNQLWPNTTTDNGFKICRRCAISKPNIEFGKNKRHTDGLHSYCKQCVRELSYGH